MNRWNTKNIFAGGDPCCRFEYLICEAEDRILSKKESSFLADHAAICPTCEETMMAEKECFNLLRSQKLTYEGDDSFDLKVMRLIKVQNGRDTWKYWFPALLSAGIAAIATFALMQVLSGSTFSKPIVFPNRSAMNSASNVTPQLVYPESVSAASHR